MAKQLEMELKVGLFVTLGLIMVMVSILVLGGTESFFTRTKSVSVHFSSVEGLIPGAKVVIGGIQVGTVSKVDFDSRTKDIKVQLRVAKKYEQWVKSDSTAEINTQGVLGDKFITIAPGSPEAPILEDGAEIANRAGGGLNELLSKSDKLMVSLNSIAGSLDRLLKTFEKGNRSETFFQGMASTARNLADATEKLNRELDKIQLNATVKNLNGIFEKINNGTGTLGALVNDPGLYYDVRALMGGANRNRVVRNLVRQTVKSGEKAQSAQDDGADSSSGDRKGAGQK